VRERGAGAGLLSALYLVALPFVAATATSRLFHEHQRSTAVLLAAALGALAVLWFVMVSRLVSTVRDLLRGREVAARGGLLWLATILFAAISFATPAGASARAGNYTVRPGDSLWSIASAHLGSGERWPEIVAANRGRAVGESLSRDPRLIRPGWRLEVPGATTLPKPVRSGSLDSTGAPAGHVPAPTPSRVEGESSRATRGAGDDRWGLSALATVPIVLAAKRRQDFLRQSRVEVDPADVEETIALLRSIEPEDLAGLRRLVGEDTSGVLRIDERTATPEGEPSDPTPIVAIVLHADEHGCEVAFARPGFALPVGPMSPGDVADRAVVLADGARCVIAQTPADALRSLALRRSFDDAVLYLGPAEDLDADLIERCVSLAASSIDPRGLHGEHAADEPTGPVVEILRAEPRITGLAEEFVPGLRRRCIEMTAYLAVHGHEAVTGERLRARVLANREDASARTLNNVSSALRRGLGGDRRGPRLHPVSPAGLYRIHGVRCDLVEFHELVDASRQSEQHEDELLEAALSLVTGEPLAATLRGFEWFLAEGHLARLQRDGEWAALRLAELARGRGDVDLAFWAIERGRLLDPYSDALEAALHRVPRLREFGGDRPGAAQHESVRTR
jgi:hypothetical protein